DSGEASAHYQGGGGVGSVQEARVCRRTNGEQSRGHRVATDANGHGSWRREQYHHRADDPVGFCDVGQKFYSISERAPGTQRGSPENGLILDRHVFIARATYPGPFVMCRVRWIFVVCHATSSGLAEIC